MKRYFGFALLVFVGTAGWRIGDSLSADALSMAVGVLFGVLAGIPAALLVMAGGRRASSATEDGRQRRDGAHAAAAPMMGSYLPQQPPVIVVAGPPAMQPALGPGDSRGGQPWDMPPRSARSFKVVGEREEWVEDW